MPTRNKICNKNMKKKKTVQTYKNKWNKSEHSEPEHFYVFRCLNLVSNAVQSTKRHLN